jgi:hypothetical protein
MTLRYKNSDRIKRGNRCLSNKTKSSGRGLINLLPCQESYTWQIITKKNPTHGKS